MHCGKTFGIFSGGKQPALLLARFHVTLLSFLDSVRDRLKQNSILQCLELKLNYYTIGFNE